MSAEKFGAVSGFVFGLVALAHVSRAVLSWDAVIGGWLVPVWVSWLVVVLAGCLSAWGFRLAGCCRRGGEGE